VQSLQQEVALREHDRWNPNRRRTISDEITTLVAVNGAVVLALIVLALFSPTASEWISAAAQAEFVGSDASPTSTQIARPADEMRIVRSN
jgi:hypothetical protein